MSAVQIKVVAIMVALVTLLGMSAWAGYAWRNRSCQLTEAKNQAAQQAASVASVTQARAQDHGNAQAAAKAESDRVIQSSATAAHFDQLQQEVKQHEKATIDEHGRGNADPEFMRIWREANAGGHSAT